MFIDEIKYKFKSYFIILLLIFLSIIYFINLGFVLLLLIYVILKIISVAELVLNLLPRKH